MDNIQQQHLPASFIGEAVAHGPHVVAYRGPFRAADDANVLDGQDGKEEVLIGSVIPVLVHDGFWPGGGESDSFLMGCGKSG